MTAAMWILVAALVSTGSLLTLIAAIGVLRLPDLPTRMHASTKSATLGAALVLTGVAIRFGETGVVVRTVLIILFLFITAPVAAHVIARAAFRAGVPLCDETVHDEVGEQRLAEMDPEA